MIEKLIKRIARSLDKEEIPYMIIGGQAVLLYGTPRLTRDIDITLGISTDKFSSVERLCKKLRLRMLLGKPEDFAKKTQVLPAEDVTLKIRVDFIFSFTPYEKQAIDRIRKVKVRGYSVKFASPEDVVIHKMFAARAIDFEDVKNILLKQRRKMNFKYIRSWLSKFSALPGQQDILKNFNRLAK